MQKRQRTGDDAAITNVKLKCRDGQIIGGHVDYDENVKDVTQFSFKGRDSCSDGQAVCGIKLKTEFNHEGKCRLICFLMLY